jgi:hypothetical protein
MTIGHRVAGWQISVTPLDPNRNHTDQTWACQYSDQYLHTNKAKVIRRLIIEIVSPHIDGLMPGALCFKCLGCSGFLI